MKEFKHFINGEYVASARPDTPLERPRCGNCESCCDCASTGYRNLTIHYLDSTVPDGSCKRGCRPFTASRIRIAAIYEGDVFSECRRGHKACHQTFA